MFSGLASKVLHLHGLASGFSQSSLADVRSDIWCTMTGTTECHLPSFLGSVVLIEPIVFPHNVPLRGSNDNVRGCTLDASSSRRWPHSDACIESGKYDKEQNPFVY